MAMKSEPLVVLVNLWVYFHCHTTRYLAQAFYYQIPIIQVCPAVNLCYGRHGTRGLPKWRFDEYSLTDGIHPWGKNGVNFLGNILYAWWRRYDELVSDELHDWSAKASEKGGMPYVLPPPLYADKPIGVCVRCDALAGDADHILRPLPFHKVDDPPRAYPIYEPHLSKPTNPFFPPFLVTVFHQGFRSVTRVKVGYGGFNPNDTKSSTKRYQL